MDKSTSDKPDVKTPWRPEETRWLPMSVLEEIDLQLRDFGEIPDRTSPEDFPEGYILTRAELCAAFCRIVEADRKARPSQLAPVAWRYKYGIDGPWKLVDSKDLCNDLPGYYHEPLYASAPVSARLPKDNRRKLEN